MFSLSVMANIIKPTYFQFVNSLLLFETKTLKKTLMALKAAMMRKNAKKGFSMSTAENMILLMISMLR